MTFVLVGASLAAILLVKGCSGSSSVSVDDKNVSLIKEAPVQGPDEIERARSAFAEELPWPKSNREDANTKGVMA